MIFTSQREANRTRARQAGTALTSTTPTGGSTVMSAARRRGTTPPINAPGPSGTAIGDARRPSAGAVTVGTAVPRATAGTTPSLPDASLTASNASGTARAAGQRARRRGVGSSVLSGLPVTGAPGARTRTRTLLGY